MKRTLYNFSKTALGGICLFMLAFSCMKEGTDCPADITLRFSYTFNEHEKDLFSQEVNELYLYIFDDDDRFYAALPVDVSSLGPSNTYSLQLDRGDYRIIALGNLDESSYWVEGAEITRSTYVSLIPDDNGEVNGSLPDLFYGAAELGVSLIGDNTGDISMVRNTKNINVLIPEGGGTRTIPDTDYSVRITGSNGSLDFENNTVATPTIYKPTYSKTVYENTVHDLAQFKILKLTIGGDTAIELYHKGELRRSDDLVAILTAEFPHVQTDDDLLRYSDYQFVYELDDDGNFILTSISAGPWSKQFGQQGGI